MVFVVLSGNSWNEQVAAATQACKMLFEFWVFKQWVNRKWLRRKQSSESILIKCQLIMSLEWFQREKGNSFVLPKIPLWIFGEYAKYFPFWLSDTPAATTRQVWANRRIHSTPGNKIWLNFQGPETIKISNSDSRFILKNAEKATWGFKQYRGC